MQIFFVIDELKNLQEKIDLVSRIFNAEIKFFVPTHNYTKINDNAFVLQHLAGVYDGGVNKKIDEYIKSEKFNLSNVLLYYSSSNVSANKLKEIESKIRYRYDAIYLEKKRNLFKNFFKKLYSKIISWMFRVEDAGCYTKVQYLSIEFMEHLKNTNFNNYILKAKNSAVIEVESEEENNSLKTKFKLKKYNIVNVIMFFIILIIYIVLSNIFKLKFYIHFMFIMLILLEIALAIMLIVNNIFSLRFKK